MEYLEVDKQFDYRSKLSKEQKQIFRTKFSEKSVIKGLTWNWIYLSSIYAAIIMCFYVVNTSSSYVWVFTVVFCSVLFCTRQMRGLENIVHFGSHNNFSKKRKLNDFLTNLFAAWPMLQETVLKIFGIWHATIALIITVIHSAELALFVTFTWMLIMFFALPFLRSIAEISEHDYELGTSVSETTFNNLGLLDHVLIHPAGDAWHSLHHLHPTVSWWKQRQAHNYLMKHDSAYRNVINRDKLRWR